jgi:DNA-directed DNA polymerase III PolC
MFTHLHAHSYYSFLDGILSPWELAQAAVEAGMPALALTDHHGLTGAIEFYEACQDFGIKPILGLELGVNHQQGKGNLILLAMGMRGWSSLCRLSSLVQSAPHRDPTQGVAFEALVQNQEGLICLSGGKRGLAGALMERNQLEMARKFLGELGEVFQDRLYLEIQWQHPADRHSVQQLIEAAEYLHLPTVATNNVHYLKPEQAELQRTLSAMRLNCRLDDLPAGAPTPPGCHFTSAQEMAERFAEYPEAIASIQEITECCNLVLPLGEPQYPIVDLPGGTTPLERLRELAFAGAKERYGGISPEIQSRLDYELKIIAEKGYESLFLIVREILAFARQTGVPISSRGSAASSLVAYCLGITTPDPLGANLYFERFLNPARSSPPDIDVDLCSVRREGVIRYVYEQYGEDRVAMVATINRFQRRSALREVAKAYGLSKEEIKDLTAQVPWRGWGPRTRRRRTDEAPFQEVQQRFPQYKALFQDAGALLDFPHHLSVHPGGIVITPGPMTDLVPVHLASKGILITQFDLESVEKMGLVKIDLLGTRGLTVLGNVAEKVASWRATEFRTPLEVLEAIPEDDPDTTALVHQARTIGCFAIESPGMRATLREIDAQSPEDIMIALALYRPGPMTGGLKDAFVQRHLGKQEVTHIHPALASLLENTYGVILYQEQVLRIASELAGLSLADADLLRRAMSHFDPGGRMKTLKRRFVAGAQEISGVPVETGERIWDMMAAFAGYGFPKAHAVSYAQVAWRSAWCKAHYPAEFMAAVLGGWGGYYRQRVYLSEARRLGLEIRPPHINHSQRLFVAAYPDGTATLYMGLDQVRDLTRRTQKRILSGRPFRSLTDFLTRVDPRPKEAENLIRVGALRGLGTIPDLLAKIQRESWRLKQPPLFEMDEEVQREDWDLPTRMSAQQEILGIGVDAHPLALVAEPISALDPLSTVEVIDRLEDRVRLAGVMLTVQRFHSGGDTYHMLELEDLEGVIPVRMSREFYQRNRTLLSSSKPFVVEGLVTKLDTTREIVVQAQRVLAL